MKAKAEPCLRDYLTIHVHPSVLLGERYRKTHIDPEMGNPLMNKKLKLAQEQDKDRGKK